MNTFIHTYIHTYIHSYIHSYIHTYIHACIHTYKICTGIFKYIIKSKEGIFSSLHDKAMKS